MSIRNTLQQDVNAEMTTPDSMEEKKPQSTNSSGSGRLIALDAVRGLAVIGMYLQHFALNETNAIVSGNTTLLFILCGGISYSIMAGRMLGKGIDIKTFRTRMLARSVFIDIIGYLLIMLNAPFGVILPAYAGLFILALLLVRRSTRTLVVTTAALLLTAPPLMILGGSLLSGAYLLSDIAGGPMSALALAPVFVAGMAIGRINLQHTRTAFLFVASGGLIVAISKLLATFVLPGLNRSFEAWLASVLDNAGSQPDPYAIWPHNVDFPMWHMLFWAAPHSASTFQTLMGLGIALLVLGIVCLIPQKLSAVLKPFAAVGRVALTMYTLQFIVIWILQLAGIDLGLGSIPLGDLLVAIVVIAISWIFAQRPTGPLEGLMRKFDQAFTPAASPSIASSKLSSNMMNKREFLS